MKDCGVAVAMLPGHSWAPTPVDGFESERGRHPGGAMLGLAAIVVSEKLLPHGEAIGRLAGAAFIVFALSVAASPRGADAAVLSMPSGAATMTDM